MIVREIDVDDDGEIRAFWEAAKEGETFERPYAAFWSLNAATVSLRFADNPYEQHAVAAFEDGEVVGTSQLSLPRLDNTHLALMDVNVRPDHRRRGVGAALLETSTGWARAHRRTTVVSEVNMAFTRPPASAGSRFLEKRGFTTASLDIHRVLELPVAAGHLDTLDADAASYHTDYRLVTFADRVPDDYLSGFCALQSAFNGEAPLGDLEMELEVWDEQRVRNNEERSRRQGRRVLATVAIARDGDLVALTELATAEDLPETAFQSGTLVMPGHRGHRLGMAAKIANLRRLQADFPVARLLHSWNAEENGPMVAINEAIGFRPVEYVAEMQHKL